MRTNVFKTSVSKRNNNFETGPYHGQKCVTEIAQRFVNNDMRLIQEN